MIGPGFAAYVGRLDFKKLLKALSWIAGLGIAATVTFTWGVSPT